MSEPRRLVVAITGASGVAFGIRALELARDLSDVETHLVMTKAGRRTVAEETELSVRDVVDLADEVHPDHDTGGPLASGSFATVGMLVAPCSIKTLSAIANAYDDSLVARAADVTLKENRRLVLLVRETPLSAIHLRLMAEVTSAGGVIMPPVPAFYLHPSSVQDIVDHTAARALDVVGCTVPMARWGSQPDSSSGS